MLSWLSVIAFGGRRVWTATYGSGTKPPLVCVAGGPGMPHDYIAPLAQVAASGRPVIFYDPLGSGRSERPPGVAWTVDVYREELEAVCRGLPRFHLFAHSAAVFAVVPFAARRPPGLRALVLGSTPASIPVYQDSVRALLALPPAELATFERMDCGVALRDPGYLRIWQRFVGQHICRARPFPDGLTQALRTLNPDAHRSLKGGMLLYTSELRSWDGRAALAEIAAPTLITRGRHDTLPLAASVELQRLVSGARLLELEHSSHMPHFEEPQRYSAAVSAFLDAHDGAL